MTDALSELYRRDPLNLTNDDVEAIVADLESKQVTWLALEEEAKTTGKAPRSAKVKIDMEDLLNLKLGDLS